MAKGRAGATRRTPALPDVAYIVRPGDVNEELRYSLRSLAVNAAGLYRKVWIVGTVPSWLRNVEPMPLDPQSGKWENIRQSVTALAHDDRVASQVVIFNDDIYVTDPISEWVTYSWGLTADRLRPRDPNRNSWVRAMFHTDEWLKSQGVEHGRCFEGHVPIRFDRKRLAAVLDAYPEDRLLLYASLFELAGVGDAVPGGNCKCGAVETFTDRIGLDMPYLSSNDESFAAQLVGGYIRGMFREPSRFEEG